MIQISDSQLAPEGAACNTFYDFSGRPAIVPKIEIWKTTATVLKTKKIDFDILFCANLRYFLYRFSYFFEQICGFFLAHFLAFFGGIFNGFGLFCLHCTARRSSAARRAAAPRWPCRLQFGRSAGKPSPRTPLSDFPFRTLMRNASFKIGAWNRAVATSICSANWDGS